VVVAGEPGGSIPSIRQRIETAWGARVFDHYGMTEVGPVSVESIAAPREQIILESHYIAEIVSPYSDQPTPIGEVGELVLTNLTRVGSPLIRYRTGDLVCRSESLARLPEGILGRTDEMIHLRGNNVYPGALEAILRRFPEVAEYRVTIDESGAMAEVRIEIEPIPEAGEGITEQIGKAIRDELLFRVEVKIVSNLPRFEMKAKRMIRKKKINSEM
jgi:phenylacetate-CoA ligase